MRTLVVHTGGIGDFLLTCPAISALAAAGAVDLLGQPERLALGVESGIAQGAHNLDDVDFGSLFSNPSERLRTFMGDYDRAVVWMRDDGELTRALKDCGLSEVRCFPGLPPTAWRGHASQYYWECLGLPGEAPQFRLPIPAADEPLDIILHPGSGGRKKNWPMDNYIALAGALASAGRDIAWCLGPAEEALNLPAGSRCLPELSLSGLAGRLAAARAYAGNDSGITHLAAAVDCPTVALFGPTDPAVWAPRGDHVCVLRDTPWPTVEAVRQVAMAPTRRPWI